MVERYHHAEHRSPISLVPASLGKVFYEDAIIHRFVTTSRQSAAQDRPAAQSCRSSRSRGRVVTIDEGRDKRRDQRRQRSARYTPYVQMAEAIDAKNLVSAYVHFYPLIQQDYRDLGYPKGYFNDRLIEAIDDLLAAPELTDPLQLVQPKVLYQYSDPELRRVLRDRRS